MVLSYDQSYRWFKNHGLWCSSLAKSRTFYNRLKSSCSGRSVLLPLPLGVPKKRGILRVGEREAVSNNLHDSKLTTLDNFLTAISQRFTCLRLTFVRRYKSKQKIWTLSRWALSSGVLEQCSYQTSLELVSEEKMGTELAGGYMSPSDKKKPAPSTQKFSL